MFSTQWWTPRDIQHVHTCVMIWRRVPNTSARVRPCETSHTHVVVLVTVGRTEHGIPGRVSHCVWAAELCVSKSMHPQSAHVRCVTSQPVVQLRCQEVPAPPVGSMDLPAGTKCPGRNIGMSDVIWRP